MKVFWLDQSGTDVPAGDEWLSPAERSALDRLTIPKRRADWLLGRWTAKNAVAARLGLDCTRTTFAGIEIRSKPSGAPAAFIEGEAAELSISISHSHGVGLCAVAAPGTRLGCDVEHIEPRGQAFLEDFFTPEERLWASANLPADRDRIVTALWSTKEAVLKALACGLRADTRSVAVGSLETPLCRCGDWHRFHASHATGLWRGWWRTASELVWTIAAEPAPEMPERLPA